MATHGPPGPTATGAPLLVQEPGRPVRELQVANFVGVDIPPLRMPALPPATAPMENMEAHDRRLRSRVKTVVALIAAYVLVGGFIQYMFALVEMEHAIERVREVTHSKLGYARAQYIIHSSSMSFAFHVLMGLTVPLCGYLSVRKNKAWLAGCFCGCNALTCCCGLMTLTCLLLFAGTTTASVPLIEDFLERCDPVQCMPKGYGVTDTANVVDCLAAGMWKSYKPRFDGPRYPYDCPKGFLQCDSDDGEDDDQVLPAEDFPTEEANVAEEEPTVEEPPLEEMGAAEGSSARDIITVPQLEEPPAEELPPDEENVAEEVVPGRRLFEDDWNSKRRSLGRPKEPIEDCRLTPAVHKFHEVRVLVPELAPHLLLYVVVRSLLLVPGIALGCLGFWWGNAFFSRLQQGYAQIAYASSLEATELQITRPVVLNASIVMPSTGVHAGGPQQSVQLQRAVQPPAQP